VGRSVDGTHDPGVALCRGRGWRGAFPPLAVIIASLLMPRLGLGQVQPSRILTEDVDNFFAAVALAGQGDDPARVIEEEYLQRGTHGLRHYWESGRIEGAARLWASYSAYRPYYEVVHRFYRDALARLDVLAAPYSFFSEELEGAETPPLYFIIGHFQGGATLFEGGLVIALDNWAADWEGLTVDARDVRTFDPVDLLQPVIAHELTHFHQACWEDCGSLLAEVVMEGSADFVAWLITGAPSNHFNEPTYAYYAAHEPDVWRAFLEDRAGTELSPWLYDNDVEPLPANLGYAIGHAVARAYYDRRNDKRAALRDILAVTDYEAFLTSSGYAPSP